MANVPVFPVETWDIGKNRRFFSNRNRTLQFPDFGFCLGYQSNLTLKIFSKMYGIGSTIANRMCVTRERHSWNESKEDARKSGIILGLLSSFSQTPQDHPWLSGCRHSCESIELKRSTDCETNSENGMRWSTTYVGMIATITPRQTWERKPPKKSI